MSVPKPASAAVTSLATISCAPLLLSFTFAFSIRFSVSAAKAIFTNSPVTEAMMSGFSTRSSESSAAPARLSFCSASTAGR